MAGLGRDPYFAAHSHGCQNRSAESLDLASIEIGFPSQVGDAQPINDTLPQPGLFAQVAGRVNGNHAAKILRQRIANGAGNAAATGEAGNIGAIRIDPVFPPQNIQDVQDDTNPLARVGIVAGAMRARESSFWSSQILRNDSSPLERSLGEMNKISPGDSPFFRLLGTYSS